MRTPVLVVLAAGIGSRYGGIKQIEPIGPSGEILLDYSIFDALRAGFREIVLVVRPEIEAAVRDRVDPRVGRQGIVRYVNQTLDAVPGGFHLPEERVKPWGTAHAVLQCQGTVHAPFAVINADDFYGRSAFASLFSFLDARPSECGPMEIGLIGYSLPTTLTEHGHVSRGVCQIAPDGYLSRIDERKRIRQVGGSIQYEDRDGCWVELDPSTVVSMNMWGFPERILSELSDRFARFLEHHAGDLDNVEFLLPDVVGDLVRAGAARVRVFPAAEPWFGVTYSEDKPIAQRRIRELIEDGVYPARLWSVSDDGG